MKKYNVAVVGATGMVGRKMLQVLAERQLPIDNLYLFASARSAGSKVEFMGKEYTVIELTEENILARKIDIALFSAGGSTSKAFAPIFANACCVSGIRFISLLDIFLQLLIHSVLSDFVLDYSY